MDDKSKLRVAIVGGGLGGIALGIALKTRGIDFTIYEARKSFTEIGAGINVGPTAVRALSLIEPSLGEKVLEVSTGNPPPNEAVWMRAAYGAPTATHADGEKIVDFYAFPTGGSTMHRQELLQVLSDKMGSEHAKFNKKLTGYEQDENQVTLSFADGSSETASILVGCDGIHSQVRIAMFGKDNPVSRPHFCHEGVYRAVVPMGKAVEVLGESARQGTCCLGPHGMFVRYAVSGGKFMNCGAWSARQDCPEGAWIVPNQKQQLDLEYQHWGEQIKRLISLFPPETSYWAAYSHTRQPESFQDKRVILMGDSAHAMVPHQGAGASQAAEDALILAEVLTKVESNTEATVVAGLRAVDEIRKPRFLRVQELSAMATSRWFDFWGNNPEGEALAEWTKGMRDSLDFIWGVDLVAEVNKAKQRFDALVS